MRRGLAVVAAGWLVACARVPPSATATGAGSGTAPETGAGTGAATATATGTVTVTVTVTATATVTAPSAETEAALPRSGALPNGLHNPMPGGTLAGYAADTGLDIAGTPRPVFALASGTLDYAEPGHTLWTGKRDTPFTIRFELDAPIAYGDRLVTHVYYGHLSKLAHVQHEGDKARRHVEAGEFLGFSGVARGSPHLHVGLLLDRDVTQYSGTFLSADEIRGVLGNLPNKTRLPKDAAADAIYERLR